MSKVDKFQVESVGGRKESKLGTPQFAASSSAFEDFLDLGTENLIIVGRQQIGLVCKDLLLDSQHEFGTEVCVVDCSYAPVSVTSKTGSGTESMLLDRYPKGAQDEKAFMRIRGVFGLGHYNLDDLQPEIRRALLYCPSLHPNREALALRFMNYSVSGQEGYRSSLSDTPDALSHAFAKLVFAILNYPVENHEFGQNVGLKMSYPPRTARFELVSHQDQESAVCDLVSRYRELVEKVRAEVLSSKVP